MNLRVPFATFLLIATINVSAQQLSINHFKSPENISKPLTWWHWINGNVTKQGIKNDLLDMKRVGIGGVQVFDTHMYLPKGPVRYGSDSWHEHIQYAIKTCDSLGLEFYITNSPGWSGAGGPWVTLEKSMKQLVYAERTIATKGQNLALSLPYSKKGFYKDVVVIAVPEAANAKVLPQRILMGGVAKPELFDGNYSSGVSYAVIKKGGSTLLYEFSEAVTLNNVVLDIAVPGKKLSLSGAIEFSLDGKKYQDIEKLAFADHEAETANFSISFAAKKMKFLRVNLEGTKDFGKDFTINEISTQYLNNTTNSFKRTGMVKSPFSSQDLFNKENMLGIATKDVIDVTRFFDKKTGELNWSEMPEGKWNILRFGYTTTAKHNHPAVDEGTGYEIDKLDPEAVKFQFEKGLGRIIKDAGPLAGKVFKGILFDSFEGGYQNWTQNMPAEFKRRNGYDINLFLPILAGRSVETGYASSAFLWDFQQTLTDMFSENYYQTMQTLAHKHGLVTFSETQGGPMSPGNGNRFVDVPMNEFWTDGIERREKLIKQTTSIANVLGKPVVGAEAFTSKPEFGKWQNLPDKLKRIGDFAFSLGINKFIFHTYAHQPYENILPSFTMGRYGTHFGRTNSWWKYAPEWGHYLGRAQYLLQQGKTVADVCYLFPRDVIFEFPSKVPNIPTGFNYDIIYPQYLSGLKVDGAKMTLQSGANYSLMVLPEYPYMTLETLQALKKLLQQGANLYGPPPIAASGYKDFTEKQPEFKQLVSEIWGGLNGKTKNEKIVGKGRLFWGITLEEAIKKVNLQPDVIFAGGAPDSLKYIHKKTKEGDVYFFTNQSGSSKKINFNLRVAGKRPEVWDAFTGNSWEIKVFDTIGNRTVVPFDLAPYASVFLVFEKNITGSWIKNITSENGNDGQSSSVEMLGKDYIATKKGNYKLHLSTGKTQEVILNKELKSVDVKGTWTINFLDGRGAPPSLKIPSLKLWNEFEEQDIKHYSGTAEYQSKFTLNTLDIQNQRTVLSLDEVYDIAEVIVNGKSAGVIWKQPYQLDITSFVKKGVNDISIKVTNRWINRLIGDEYLPTDVIYDASGSKFSAGKMVELPKWLATPEKRENKRYTFATWKHYEKTSPLVNSGLKGNVKVLIYNRLL